MSCGMPAGHIINVLGPILWASSPMVHSPCPVMMYIISTPGCVCLRSVEQCGEIIAWLTLRSLTMSCVSGANRTRMTLSYGPFILMGFTLNALIIGILFLFNGLFG